MFIPVSASPLISNRPVPLVIARAVPPSESLKKNVSPPTTPSSVVIVPFPALDVPLKIVVPDPALAVPPAMLVIVAFPSVEAA